MNEQDLVREYVQAKEQVETLEKQFKQAKDRFEKAQTVLIDDLQMRQASKTARYDAYGSISIGKPIVGARAVNEEQLFTYLKEIGRDDLLKLTCHHRTLSSFVKEMLENGSEIPVFIEYWMKPTSRLTK